MPLTWWWDFGVDLPVDFYARSHWGVASQVNTDTQNKVSLAQPSDPTKTPGEQAHVRVQDTQFLTPPIPGGPHNKGWWQDRWHQAFGGFATGASIIRLLDGFTERVRIRGATSGLPQLLEMFVNGTSIGTTTNQFGDASAVLQIQFDLTTTPPQGGLWVNGTNEIPVTPGSGSPTTFDRVELGAGGTVTTTAAYHGMQLFFNDTADVDGSNPNLWGTAFLANTVSGDAGWTPSAGTNITAVSDKDFATYTESVTDPDSLTYGFQATTDILAGWNPTKILGVAGFAFSTADVINNGTVNLGDGTGSTGTATLLVTGTGNFIVRYSILNSLAGSWTDAQLDAATVLYSIAS